MIDFIVNHLDAVIGFVLGILAYAYKKGKADTAHENSDRRTIINTKALKKEVDELVILFYDLKKTVHTIEEALDRSYATTKYVHDTFPSKEVFDIKMESVQEHITNRIDVVLSMLKYKEGK